MPFELYVVTKDQEGKGFQGMSIVQKEQEPVSERAILHFPLYGLLPDGYEVAFNSTLGTLAVLAYEVNRTSLIEEQQFTPAEISFLRPLLDTYPYFAVYEVLLASVFEGKVTTSEVERWRDRLKEVSTRPDEREQIMCPIRNMASRTRLKTRLLGIEIASVKPKAYALTAVKHHFLHKSAPIFR